MFNPPFLMKYEIEEHETLKELFFHEYQGWIDQYHLENVTTDFFEDCKKPRPYKKLMNRILKPYIKEFITQWNGDTSDWMAQWWFAQYTDKSDHSWHIHPGAFFACVYMLDLPDSSMVTELEGDPFKDQDVKEGDMIIFPGSWPHRSPPSDSRQKTIIAGNILWNLPDQKNPKYK